MNFKAGDIIKHERFSDVALLITCVGHLCHNAKQLDIAGSWVNQGFTKSYFIGESDSFSIPIEKLSEWSYAVNGYVGAKLRECAWLPLVL